MTLDESTLKGGGFLKQRQADFFVVRVKVLVGDATAEQLTAIAEIARAHGDGTVHFTVRQCVEIPFVRIEHFEAVTSALKAAGLGPGACGPRVRVPVCCPGSTICKRGLNDTKSLAKQLDARMYGRGGLPHKFKVGVTGCSASCAKPTENDLGFMGAVRPVFDEQLGECISCGVCEQACPTGAISLDGDGRPVIDMTLCDSDGKCVAACPTSAIRAESQGWRVFVGGKHGRTPALGVELERFVDGDRAVAIAEGVLAAYVALGEKDERVHDTVQRVGLDAFRHRVASEAAAFDAESEEAVG